MVFQSTLLKTEDSNRTNTKALMSSSSALKTQPLHNFPLHDLKWTLNNSNGQRLRKLSDSSHKSPQHADNDSSGSSHDHRTEKSEKKVAPSDVRSKICIRFRTKNSKPDVEVADVGDQSLNAVEAEELVPKTWNLRPRKPISKRRNHKPTRKQEPSRSKNVADPKAAEKKLKTPKFFLSLSREEIEEDIFSMSGSKASRKPKKRVKSVQKQIEAIFPGLWLDSITPDSYKVSEAHTKGC